MPTTPETIYSIYALNKLGVVCDMLDPRSNASQIEYYLNENKYIVNEKSKSKLLAIFLSLFLGTMGIHRFYLGYIKIGIVQFILWVLGFFTGGITWIITEVWSFIEFILIFINKIKDSNGNELE
mgnify:CR=1 FL=1